MAYWQAKADLGTSQLVFGVSAEDLDTARDRAIEVIGNHTALLEILEIPPAEERLSCNYIPEAAIPEPGPLIFRKGPWLPS